MKLIGLTGGISTGKSTVSRFLAEEGIPIIDADKIARDIVKPGRKANQLIRQHFGNEVFLPDGHLDRPKLGQLIFGDPEKRKVLNRCTHPYVRLEMVKQAFLYWATGCDVVVFDVPLLFESKLDRFMFSNIVVYCSSMLQLQRLRNRDNLTEDEALQRINAQMSMSEKVEKANIVLDNSADLNQLKAQVKSVVKKIRPSTLIWLLEYAGPPFFIIIASVFIKQYGFTLFSSMKDSVASLQ